MMMQLRTLATLAVLFTGLAAAGTEPTSGVDTAFSAANYRATVDQYCVSCHNKALQTAGLVLETADISNPGDAPEVWERVITKLSLSAMPPVGVPHPDAAFYEGFLDYLKTELGDSTRQNPNPGRPSVHRLNRTEYANAIRDLLAVDVDAEALLPADNIGQGFDNIADVLAVSPLLMERYLFAAGRIASLAVGPAAMQPAAEIYVVPDTFRQDQRMNEALPFGSRGGTTVAHRFPLDGNYVLDIKLHRSIEGYIRGLREQHTIDVRIDHKRVGTLTVGGETYGPSGPTFTENQVVHYSGNAEQVGYEFSADDALQIQFAATAGEHVVGVSFVDENTKESGFLTPRLTMAELQSYKGGDPTVASLIVTGPFDATGPGETASRQKIFVCHPEASAEPQEAEDCAREILSGLARLAYRRTIDAAELNNLLDLYRSGSEGGSFESGIELALQGILAGPEFLFRIEQDPADVAPGEVYRISDFELAARLSFFLWSSIPDEELLAVAEAGGLQDSTTLKQQVSRMIADPRFERFVNNFGRQWLAVRDVDIAEPNQSLFPEFDDELRVAFKQEMSMWFASLIRNDESVVDLLTSDYTYVNERLARHYGIPGVYGSRFRPVELTSMPMRHGLFGKGALLTATAFNNRTSPVVRGKWVLENLLNMPPPPAPEDVPALEVTSDGKALTLKQAMEKHRANPVCASCHKLMDPIGFALENFDAIGAYRTRYAEADADVDPSGLLFDGSEFLTAQEFRGQFTKHTNRVVHTAAEKVLTYSLGRGLQYYDQPVVRQIVADSADENYTWSSIIIGVIESTPFQYRRASNNVYF
jgi:mono/diheme cytochrome c family protein